MDKKTILIVAAALLVIVLAVGLYSNNSQSVSQTTQTGLVVAQKQLPPLTIGASLALSGNLAYIGEGQRNGLLLGVEELNKKEGKTAVELIIEDNKGDAKEAVTGVSKLLDVDNVPVVYSGFTAIVNAIKKTVFDSNKVLYYASTVTTFAKEDKHAFQDFIDANPSGELIAKVVAKEKVTKVGFLTEISDQCKEFEKGFLKQAQINGIQVIAREDYSSDTTDLKTQLLKLSEKNPQALVTCTWRHNQILMKQLKELDLIKLRTFQIFAPYLPASDTPQMRELYEENNMISSWVGFVEEPTEKLQADFVQKYSNTFGKKPLVEAAYAYDAVFILYDAYKKCENPTSDCISLNLLKTKFEGAAGQLSFNQDHTSNREIPIIYAQNGKWKEYELN